MLSNVHVCKLNYNLIKEKIITNHNRNIINNEVKNECSKMKGGYG